MKRESITQQEVFDHWPDDILLTEARADKVVRIYAKSEDKPHQNGLADWIHKCAYEVVKKEDKVDSIESLGPFSHGCGGGFRNIRSPRGLS